MIAMYTKNELSSNPLMFPKLTKRYKLLQPHRTVLFHHPSRRELRALEIHRRSRPGERAGKDTFVAKRKVAEHCKTLSH